MALRKRQKLLGSVPEKGDGKERFDTSTMLSKPLSNKSENRLIRVSVPARVKLRKVAGKDGLTPLDSIASDLVLVQTRIDVFLSSLFPYRLHFVQDTPSDSCVLTSTHCYPFMSVSSTLSLSQDILAPSCFFSTACFPLEQNWSRLFLS
jgi:hypothetical protein